MQFGDRTRIDEALAKVSGGTLDGTTVLTETLLQGNASLHFLVLAPCGLLFGVAYTVSHTSDASDPLRGEVWCFDWRGADVSTF